MHHWVSWPTADETHQVGKMKVTDLRQSEGRCKELLDKLGVVPRTRDTAYVGQDSHMVGTQAGDECIERTGGVADRQERCPRHGIPTVRHGASAPGCHTHDAGELDTVRRGLSKHDWSEHPAL